MSAQDYVLIISAVGGVLTAIIGAIFSGWIALKQLPRAAQRREEIATEIKENN